MLVRHNKPVRALRGFSLIELIVVIILMAILVGIAAPRFFSSGAFEGPAFVQELASAARYAQKLAVISGCPVELEVSATGYALRQPELTTPPCTGALTMTLAVKHPGTGEDFTATVPGGVAIGGASTVRFNASGVPDAAGSFTIAGQTVFITPDSGYVEVQ